MVEEGCEFPSYGLWSNTGSVVYKTTETVTFKRVNDAWYKVYTATFVDEEGNTLGSSTFTTADSDLTYPEYDAEIGYDYTWTGNHIKAENITVTLTKTIKTFDVVIGDADAVKYNYGSKLTKPETDPEKAADAEYTYAFIGWYNGETAWDFANDTVTSNITLTAKFSETAIVYTLTFTKVDGSSVTVEYTTLTRQAKLEELKAMLHANDAQYTYTNNLPEVLPFENGRTYAETRTINKYSVTIGDNDPVEVEYGSKLVKPETDPVKAEDDEYTYKFIGWYNGEEAWGFENDEVKGNLTLTAKFEAVAKSADELEDGCEGSVKGSMPLLAVLLIAGAVVAVKKKRV